MSILLPAYPGPAQADISYLDWGGVIGSPLGGADQKLNRLGDRYALTVTMPPLESWDVARQWVAALILAQKTGAIMRWPQPNLRQFAFGMHAVDGAGQGGTTLNIRGTVPGSAFVVGEFFSVLHGGRFYLHIVTGQAILNTAGKAALSIAPMMRAPYANGSEIQFGVPMIEGFLEGNSRDWTIDLAFHVGLSFKITEAE